MAALPTTAHLVTDLSDGWLTILLNRPETRDARSNEMVEEITAPILAAGLHNRAPAAREAFFKERRKGVFKGGFGQVVEEDFGHGRTPVRVTVESRVPSRPPLSCRTSPPQGGRLVGTSTFANRPRSKAGGKHAPWLKAQVTTERVAEFFAHYLEGGVTRYELPGFYSFNFVLEDVLGGGGAASLRYDPQAKSYAQMLLDLPVTVPAAWLEDRGFLAEWKAK